MQGFRRILTYLTLVDTSVRFFSLIRFLSSRFPRFVCVNYFLSSPDEKQKNKMGWAQREREKEREGRGLFLSQDPNNKTCFLREKNSKKLLSDPQGGTNLGPRQDPLGLYHPPSDLDDNQPPFYQFVAWTCDCLHSRPFFLSAAAGWMSQVTPEGGLADLQQLFLLYFSKRKIQGGPKGREILDVFGSSEQKWGPSGSLRLS